MHGSSQTTTNGPIISDPKLLDGARLGTEAASIPGRQNPLLGMYFDSDMLTVLLHIDPTSVVFR